MNEKEFITLSFPHKRIGIDESQSQSRLSIYYSQLRSIFEKIIRVAQTRTPVRTGKLRESYRQRINVSSQSIIAGIDNTREYFTYVENGFGQGAMKDASISKTQVGVNTFGRQGVHMLGTAIEEYQEELNSATNAFLNDYKRLIGMY